MKSLYIVISGMTIVNVQYATKPWGGVTSLTMLLSGQLVLCTTHNKILLKLDLINSEGCLANLIFLVFTFLRKVEVNWTKIKTISRLTIHLNRSCLNFCVTNFSR